MPDRPADTVVRVATVFNAAEFAVTRSFLAAHGIVVAAEPIHLVNNYSHYATAVGGVPVLVPASQASDAADLLGAFGHTGPNDKKGGLRWLGYILLFGVLCGFGVAPPSSGRVIHCRRPALAQGVQVVEGQNRCCEGGFFKSIRLEPVQSSCRTRDAA